MLVAVFVCTPAAGACPPLGKPWVRLDRSNDGSAADVERLLRAELATRHIALCAGDGASEAPLAVVSTSIVENTAMVRVEVHDRVTAKVVSRDIALESVPVDTRALTIALAADELLRASWAELAVRAAPPPPRPPPIEVLDVVHDSVAPSPRAPRVSLGVAAAFDVFASALTLLGADLAASVWLVPRVRIEARFGVRAGLTQRGADGDVASNAFTGKLGAAITLTPPLRAFGVDAAARVGVARVSFVPTPDVGAIGIPSSDVAVTGELTVDGWARLASALRLVLSVGPTFAMRPVRITDGAQSIGGIDGAGVTTSLALLGLF